MPYRSTKTFGHECGFSAAFRQWRADSHCRLLHGYALSIALVFEASELDHRNWVVDFGGLRSVKEELAALFDHKTLVAWDDPQLEAIRALADKGVMEMVIVNATGCEAFAELVYETVNGWLMKTGQSGRVALVSAEVREHGANSGIYARFTA